MTVFGTRFRDHFSVDRTHYDIGFVFGVGSDGCWFLCPLRWFGEGHWSGEGLRCGTMAWLKDVGLAKDVGWKMDLAMDYIAMNWDGRKYDCW